MTTTQSALQLAKSVRNGELTASDALEEHLGRIDELDDGLNAVCFRDDERARGDAAAVDDAIAAGRAGELGPFAGVPMLIKDLNDVEGWPTTLGSKASTDSAKAADHPPVARLRRAGFVFSGKTTTPEFGSISVTESDRLGATRNPWNTDHTPGGSSGGAGAAVASGMLAAAHASDGGGSIRIPASCNGLVGLKPSRNRISSAPTKMITASTQGILTRDVADQAAIVDVMAETDPDAWEVAPPLARPLAEEVGADPGRLRIRVSVGNALGVDPAPACVEAVEKTAAALEGLGHEVTHDPITWPDAAAFMGGFLTVWSTISAGYELTDTKLMEPHNQENVAAARATDSIAYNEAVMMLQRASRSFTPQFGCDFDVLLSPTMAIEPPPVGWIWEGAEDNPGAPMINATPMAAYTAVFNVTGQPAISLPAHVSEASLPVGVQLVAPLFDEATLIRVASQLESAIGWAATPAER
ncbi:MAG: amidase [Microthrixaceae bacterium]